MKTYADEDVSVAENEYSDSDVTIESEKPVISQDKNVSAVDRFLSGSIGGPGMASGGAKDPEESLPFMGQALGGFLGEVTGGPLGGYAGSIAGTGVGSALNEIIGSVKRGEEFNANKVASDVGITALIDGLLRGTGSLYFRNEIAHETIKSLGRKIGTMKEAVSAAGDANPSLGVPKQKILNFLDDTFGKSINPFGKASVQLKRWRNILSNPNTTHVSPRALIELEDDLGDIASFSKQKIGGISLMPDVQKSSMNTAAKRLRGIVSSEVDGVASKAGHPEFGKTSKQLYKLKQKFPDSELKKSTLFPGIPATFTAGSAGLMTGYATENPILGVMTGLLVESLQSPAVKGLLYHGVAKHGAGTALSLGLSEFGRNSSNSPDEDNIKN